MGLTSVYNLEYYTSESPEHGGNFVDSTSVWHYSKVKKINCQPSSSSQHVSTLNSLRKGGNSELKTYYFHAKSLIRANGGITNNIAQNTGEVISLG